MLIYQDYEQTQDKRKYIVDSINNFKSSKEYKKMVESQQYYKGLNPTIMNRKFQFYSMGGQLYDDIFRSNNKVVSGIFKKITQQLSSYVLANGVTISDDSIKEELGRWFDVKIQELGTASLVDGVAYGYVYLDEKGRFRLQNWRGTEVIPLFDERTGIIRAVIRFWQVDASRPMYVEVYTIDGKESFTVNDKGKTNTIEEKSSYIKGITTDAFGTTVADIGNYSVLPIFPLYCNEEKTPSLSNSIKSKIDLIDIILSDFGNNLEDSNDVYWVLKNYDGQDLGEFLNAFKQYKTISVDDEGSAEPKTIDIPYQARKEALDILKKEIYEDSMALDTSILSGGSLTNVAIKANMMNLDLKADVFENQVYSFLYNVIDLFLEVKNKKSNYEIELIRRSIVNDTELIDNIQKCRSDISLETALRLNPYIKDEKKEMELIDEEGMSKYNEQPFEFPIEEEDEEGKEEIKDIAKETVNKTLNGAQTQSLLSVMSQYTSGALSLQQAINIISVSIGVSKDKARELVEGLE